MTDLQKEFEATGYTSWINADLYPDGKIYTQEYMQWLEKQVLALRQPPVSGSAIVQNEHVALYFQFDDDEPIEGVKYNGNEFTMKILPVENGFVEFTDGKKKFRMFVRQNGA